MSLIDPKQSSGVSWRQRLVSKQFGHPLSCRAYWGVSIAEQHRPIAVCRGRQAPRDDVLACLRAKAIDHAAAIGTMAEHSARVVDD